MEGDQLLVVSGCGETVGEKIQGIRSINDRYKIICMNHGHELRWGNAGGRECRAEGNTGEEKKMGQL